MNEENINEENINPDEFVDADYEYESWRETQAELLDQELRSVLLKFLKNNPYYKGNASKLKNHAVSYINYWEGE